MIHPQSATWERLLKMLAEAQSVFQRYGVLLFQEAHSLRAMDRPKLVEVNSQKESALEAICQLEQQIEREIHGLAGSAAHESIWSWLKAVTDPRAQLAQAMLTDLLRLAHLIQKKEKKNGPDRGLNPEPLAPKARIIPLDHQALLDFII